MARSFRLAAAGYSGLARDACRGQQQVGEAGSEARALLFDGLVAQAGPHVVAHQQVPEHDQRHQLQPEGGVFLGELAVLHERGGEGGQPLRDAREALLVGVRERIAPVRQQVGQQLGARGVGHAPVDAREHAAEVDGPPRPGARHRGQGVGAQLAGGTLEERLEQPLARAEVVEHAGVGDPARLGDGLETDSLGSTLLERRLRRVEDVLLRFFGAAPGARRLSGGGRRGGSTVLVVSGH
jgi:hypothetical protein